MNQYLLDYLVSPIEKTYLTRKDYWVAEVNDYKLIDKHSLEEFDVIKGIPILLPKNHVSGYMSNVLDIVFKDKSKDISKCILKEVGDEKDFYIDRLKEYVKKRYGKLGVLNEYELYSKLSKNDRLNWYMALENDEISKESSVIADEKIKTGYIYAEVETGKKRLQMAEEMINKWAVHLKEYSEIVKSKSGSVILELATGAGLGTCGIIKGGLNNSKLITVDIDYTCVKNAEGIASYLNIHDHVNPIVANFWYLPIRESSIDVVCSHYGIDESREIKSILFEISRVLKKDGIFVNVSRVDSTVRLRNYFDDLNFTREEYMRLAQMGNLYCGMGELIKVFIEYNMVLEYSKTIYHSSHDRIISVFRKV